MDIIRKTFIPTDRLSEDYLLFDIETTGFHRDKSLLYLIGCGYFEKGNFKFIQWFNDDGRSERAILEAFVRLLDKKKWKLFTFNGESFDIPFINHRFSRNKIKSRLDSLDSLDLYRILRPFQQLYHMDHGSQKSWERFLGLHREDPYNGGELIDTYRNFLKYSDKKDRSSLLLHNEEDILGMLSLIPLLSYHRMTGDSRMRIVDIRPGDNPFDNYDEALSIQLIQSRVLPRPLQTRSNMGILHAHENRIDLTLPLITTPLKYFYPDYRNYYYLPLEDRALHKSVGRYVEGKHRIQARASTCYTKEEGLFIPAPVEKKHYGIEVKDPGVPVYRRYYRDNLRYGKLETLVNLDAVKLSAYLHNLMKDIYITSLSEEADKEKEKSD